MSELKFHWRMLHGGETTALTRAAGASGQASALPDVERQVDFCRRAEDLGFTGLLTDVGATKADPILLATAFLRGTEKIEIIVAYRSAFLSPTLFTQQLNTLSQLSDGRFSLNIVAGDSPREQRYYGDHLDHDARYARTEEFLAICRALWANDGPVNFKGRYFTIENAELRTPFRAPQRRFPEIFIAGGSDAARDVAIRQGTLWMRLADKPEVIKEDAAAVYAAGKEVGLRLSLIVRPSREEALAAARELVGGLEPSRADAEKENAFVNESDSHHLRAAYELAAAEEWLTRYLWTGAIRTHGAPSIALVGTPEEVAEELMDYKRAGVTQFILAGWPKLDEMVRFGETVLPLVRQKERSEEVASA